MMCKDRVYNLSRDASEQVLGVSDQVGHKSAYTVTEAGFLRLEILAINRKGIILSSENKGADQLLHS